MKTHDALGRASRFVAQPTGTLPLGTDLQLDILELHYRFPYLPSTYVPKLLGLTGRWYLAALTRLFQEGLLCRPEESWAARNARYRPAITALTDKGRNFLQGHSRAAPRYFKAGKQFRHEFGVSLIAASFAIAAKEIPFLRLVTPDDILAHPNCPAETRLDAHPFVVKVGETPIYPDYPVFGLSYQDKAFFFMHGFEFDRNTEPLVSPESRRTILKKIEAYAQYLRQRLFYSRYGVSQVTIPFVTINETHMHNMMALVEKQCEPWIAQRFAFKCIPDFTAYLTFPDPTGHMVTENWHRAGHRPLNILDTLKATAERA